MYYCQNLLLRVASFIANKIQKKLVSNEFVHMKHVGCNPSMGKDYLICGHQHISIGDNFRALSHFRMQAICQNSSGDGPSIIIGDNVSFEDFCHVGCIEKIQIGDGTLIASKVFISDHSHGQTHNIDKRIPYDRPLVSKPVSIGNNCWIGDGACVLYGVTLGDNVIVGANSVVTHSFPSNSVIAGCPAKLIRQMS